MKKTILITGSTAGIGLETARALVSLGHHVSVHGRSAAKTEAVAEELAAAPGNGTVDHYIADLSRMSDVESLAEGVRGDHAKLDVLINNAGVYNASQTRTQSGLDVRFAVNTIAPFLLTHRLWDRLDGSARVVNLSSAAQAPVDLQALSGNTPVSDSAAYAQSKLAITMWSRSLGLAQGEDGPLVVSVNPGSLLGTKMVREAFGMAGKDVGIGVDILRRSALSDEFAAASGQYFDNDSGRFTAPHPDALDPIKCGEVVRTIESVLARLGHEASFGA